MSKRKKQPTTVIELLKEIKDAVAKIKKEQRSGYKGCIFRGEPKKFDKITSNLYRNLGDSKERYVERMAEVFGKLLAKYIEIDINKPQSLKSSEVLKDLRSIESAAQGEDVVSEEHKGTLLRELHKNYAYGANRWVGPCKSKSEIEILADIQHYGGETNFIDFSDRYLVALFFACSNDKFSGEDGRVIVLSEQGLELPPSSGRIPQKGGFIFRPLRGDDRRAGKQRSVMLFEPNGYLEYGDKNKRIESIDVPSTLKKEILIYLSELPKRNEPISAKELFPDVQGYIKSQKYTRRSMSLYMKAFTLRKDENYEDALAVVDRALAFDVKNYVLYALRAQIYVGLERYKDAISDVDRARELGNKIPELLLLRAQARLGLRYYEDALEDCNRALKLGFDGKELYLIRAQINNALGRYDDALEDNDLGC